MARSRDDHIAAKEYTLLELKKAEVSRLPKEDFRETSISLLVEPSPKTDGAMPPDLFNRLITLLTKCRIGTPAEQRAFLAESGLEALEPDVNIGGEARIFAHSLVRETRRIGAFTRDGETAFGLLLSHLEQEVAGHEEELAFVASLRGTITSRPLQPVAPSLPIVNDNLGKPSLDFTGRVAEIERLTTYLSQGRAVVISGMGGLGKTDLAKKVALLISTNFPGHRLQIDLQSDNKPLEPAEVLSRIVTSLDPKAQVPDTVEESRAKVRDLLDRNKGIVLLDNVANREQIQPLEDLWTGWAVLITSRETFVKSGWYVEPLHAMEKADAEHLVATLTSLNPRRILTAEEIATVAEVCQYHPLALRVASAYLTIHTHISVQTYCNEVRHAPLTALVTHQEFENVGKVLAYSIERLQQDMPVLSHRWHLLALMPDAFDTTLSQALLGTLHKNETLFTPLDTALTGDTLNELVRMNLLETIGTGEATRYRMHDFFIDYALRHSQYVPSQEMQQAAIRSKALALLSYGLKFDEMYRQGQQLDALHLFDDHWVHFSSAWQQLKDASDPYALFFLDHFSSVMPELLSMRLTPRARSAIEEVSLRASQIMGNQSGEAAHLGNLAIKASERGDHFTAIKSFEQRRKKAIEEGNIEEEIKAIGNLGQAYSLIDNVDTAKVHLEEALERSKLHGMRSDVAQHHINLGTVFAKQQDRESAWKHFNLGLNLAREIHDQRQESDALGNIGLWHFTWGAPSDAIDAFEQSLQISRGLGYKRGEGRTLWHIAVAYDQLGNRDKAIESARVALPLLIAEEDTLWDKVRAHLRQWGVTDV